MKTILFIALASICFIIFLTSCKKEEVVNCEPANHEILQGSWKHEFEMPLNGVLGLDPQFTFTFKSDSFFMSIHRVQDYLEPDEDCPGGEWTEYAKGIFTVMNDSLNLEGVYTESDFSVKEDGCYNIGMYLETFSAAYCESRLHLVWISSNSNKEIIMSLE